MSIDATKKLGFEAEFFWDNDSIKGKLMDYKCFISHTYKAP